jgi:hypothetical protein
MTVAGCGEGTEEADAEARLLCFDPVVNERAREIGGAEEAIQNFGVWLG